LSPGKGEEILMILDKGNWVLHVIDPPPISSSEITKSLEHQQNKYVAFQSLPPISSVAWLIKLNYVSFMPV